MSILCDMAGDFLEMELHGFGVSVWKCEASTFALGRTDGPEEIGIGVTLVGGLSWPCAASGPQPDGAVLLADPRLILEQISIAVPTSSSLRWLPSVVLKFF